VFSNFRRIGYFLNVRSKTNIHHKHRLNDRIKALVSDPPTAIRSALYNMKYLFFFMLLLFSFSILFIFNHFVDQSTGFLKMPIKLSSLDPFAGVWL
jgi:hypothetical protein